MARPAAHPIPEGFRSITPHLVCKDAVKAIDFYKSAFGAEETARLTGPDGKLLHGALRIGDSIVMLTDECPTMGAFGPQDLAGSPVSIHLSVADADAAFARATAAGATPVMPVMEMFWGARYGVFKDPFGHSWSVATQVKDLSPEEIRGNLAEAMRTQANCPQAA
jgi:PhnB protein